MAVMGGRRSSHARSAASPVLAGVSWSRWRYPRLPAVRVARAREEAESPQAMTNRLLQAEQRLFDRYGLDVESRDVWLEDPPLRVRVLEAGDGPPLVLVHGSGMAASTWAPLLPHLAGRRVLAVDLPGFGLSDPYDYGGRSLRRHAVAQVRSLLDALGLARADLVGTSLGAMWTLNFAQAHPDRAARVVAVGVPAVALP